MFDAGHLISNKIYKLGWSLMFQIKFPEVLNGYLAFPEHVIMNKKNIGCV
jgi:hypothetical protein